MELAGVFMRQPIRQVHAPGFNRLGHLEMFGPKQVIGWRCLQMIKVHMKDAVPLIHDGNDAPGTLGCCLSSCKAAILFAEHHWQLSVFQQGICGRADYKIIGLRVAKGTGNNKVRPLFESHFVQSFGHAIA